MRVFLLAMLCILTAQVALAGEQDVFVKTGAGVLWGTLETPPSPHATVLILPGSGPVNRDGNGPTIHPDMYKLLAQGLESKGIASLRIDKRGIGESAPALASESDIRFQTNVDDAKAWIADLKARTGAHCIWLFGHSEGALVAELVAKDSSDICGLILAAPPGRTLAQIMRDQLNANPNMPDDMKAQALQILGQLEQGQTVPSPPPYLYVLFRPSVQPYLIGLLPLDPAAILAQLKLPVLILQGDHDLQVSVDDAKRLAAAKPDAKLVILPGVNHVLKDAPSDRPGNIATYGDPTLPLAPGIVDALAPFVVSGT